MARSVYTTTNISDFFPEPALVEGPVIEEGVVFVIRDMVAQCVSLPELPAPLFGFSLNITGDDVFIWSIGYLSALVGRTYHWQGRQLLSTGQSLTLETDDPGWSFAITGYTLTLP